MNLDEIKSRINPKYKDTPGTESHERKWLCDEIERLRKERDELLAALDRIQDSILYHFENGLNPKRVTLEKWRDDATKAIASVKGAE